MACNGITGSGALFGLSVDTSIGKIRSMQAPSWLNQAVDFTGLADIDWMCFIPSIVGDPGEVIVDLFLDPTLPAPTRGLVQTATITLPKLDSGAASAATLSGSGFLTNINWGNYAVNEPVVQQITFKFDGNTSVPAWSPEASS